MQVRLISQRRVPFCIVIISPILHCHHWSHSVQSASAHCFTLTPYCEGTLWHALHGQKHYPSFSGARSHPLKRTCTSLMLVLDGHPMSFSRPLSSGAGTISACQKAKCFSATQAASSAMLIRSSSLMSGCIAIRSSWATPLASLLDKLDAQRIALASSSLGRSLGLQKLRPTLATVTEDRSAGLCRVCTGRAVPCLHGVKHIMSRRQREWVIARAASCLHSP